MTIREMIMDLDKRERERLALALKLPINARLQGIASAKLEAYAEVLAALEAACLDTQELTP